MARNCVKAEEEEEEDEEEEEEDIVGRRGGEAGGCQLDPGLYLVSFDSKTARPKLCTPPVPRCVARPKLPRYLQVSCDRDRYEI
jgi:hypothetical protein